MHSNDFLHKLGTQPDGFANKQSQLMHTEHCFRGYTPDLQFKVLYFLPRSRVCSCTLHDDTPLHVSVYTTMICQKMSVYKYFCCSLMNITLWTRKSTWNLSSSDMTQCNITAVVFDFVFVIDASHPISNVIMLWWLDETWKKISNYRQNKKSWISLTWTIICHCQDTIPVTQYICWV